MKLVGNSDVTQNRRYENGFVRMLVEAVGESYRLTERIQLRKAEDRRGIVIE